MQRRIDFKNKRCKYITICNVVDPVHCAAKANKENHLKIFFISISSLTIELSQSKMKVKYRMSHRYWVRKFEYINEYGYGLLRKAEL